MYFEFTNEFIGGTYTDNSGSGCWTSFVNSGCTDSDAQNFNEFITIDDGSCEYEDCFQIETSEIDVFCIEDSLTTLSVNSINQSLDFNGYEFAWFDSNTNEVLGNNSTIEVNQGSFYVVVQDENGCMQTQNFLVNNSICEIIEPCDITPISLFVDDIIHNRVRFNWSEPSSYPSHYMIRYRPLGTSSWTVMTAGPVNINEFSGTSRTRYFMEPSTTYEWNIRARVLNEDGSTNCQSSWSATSEYTTLPAYLYLSYYYVRRIPCTKGACTFMHIYIYIYTCSSSSYQYVLPGST